MLPKTRFALTDRIALLEFVWRFLCRWPNARSVPIFSGATYFPERLKSNGQSL